jgi:hypothetical protein
LELEYEDELLLVWEFIVINQMMAETIDQMDFNYRKLVSSKTALAVVKEL